MVALNCFRVLLLCATLALLPHCQNDAPGSAASSTAAVQLRIGYQKSGSLALLKWRGSLERQLNLKATQLAWAEFPSGPALLEALNAGHIDIGLVGEAPPIFAQAASNHLVYVAAEPASPRSEAILVPRDSVVRSVGQLAGRSVALNKGSNVHYFLVKALERAGLSYRDVKVVYLAPADARAAFETGAVDAWVIWDPYYAAVEASLPIRVLADAEGIVNNYLFYVGRRAFVSENPDLVRALLAEIGTADAWIAAHRSEAAQHLAQELRIEPVAMRTAVERATFGVLPITEEVIQSQQRVADAFLELGLLATPLQIRDALPRVAFRP